MTWSERNLLDVEKLFAEEVETILADASHMRELLDRGEPAPQQLAGHHLVLLFAEASTRTRLSFEIAARRLGADTYLFDRGTSSMTKGETLVDTVRNLDAIGFTMIVIRHHRSGAPWVVARHFGGHVINAGDGWHGHPTQALLDLYTLRRAWGGGRDALRGRKIAIVGDILHSRVARSNIWTLTQAGADVWLCGPKPWIRGFDQLSVSLPSDRHLSVTDSLDSALSGADAVMGLRVQKERMSGGLSAAEYVDRYQITSERLARTTAGALYLHPGPINEGVEVTREVCLGPRSLVLEQARNGVPVRMAVLSLVASAGAGAQAMAAARDLSSAMR